MVRDAIAAFENVLMEDVCWKSCSRILALVMAEMSFANRVGGVRLSAR